MLYLFWRRKFIVGMLILLPPSIIVSALIMNLANLKYKQPAFGYYIHAYMTTQVVIVRILGTVIMHPRGVVSPGGPYFAWFSNGTAWLAEGYSVAKETVGKKSPFLQMIRPTIPLQQLFA